MPLRHVREALAIRARSCPKAHVRSRHWCLRVGGIEELTGTGQLGDEVKRRIHTCRSDPGALAHVRARGDRMSNAMSDPPDTCFRRSTAVLIPTYPDRARRCSIHRIVNPKYVP